MIESPSCTAYEMFKGACIYRICLSIHLPQLFEADVVSSSTSAHSYILFAPLLIAIPPNLTSSLLLAAASTVHTAPTPTNNVLAMLSVAHRSISSCTVSPWAAFASTALSSREADASSSFLAMSLAFVGAIRSSVKGTMLGRRMVEARLRRNAVDLGSSVQRFSQSVPHFLSR
jgi:hypothetical protein